MTRDDSAKEESSWKKHIPPSLQQFFERKCGKAVCISVMTLLLHIHDLLDVFAHQVFKQNVAIRITTVLQQ